MSLKSPGGEGEVFYLVFLLPRTNMRKSEQIMFAAVYSYMKPAGS